MGVGAIPVKSHGLGWPTGGVAMAGYQALVLLLEGDVEDTQSLPKLLIGIRVRHVGRRRRPCCRLLEEAQHVRSRRAAVVIALGDLLLLDLLPPPLELSVVGVKVGLLGLESLILLLKLGRVVGWAHVRRQELRGGVGGVLPIDVKTLLWRGVAAGVGLIGIILWPES